MTDVIVPESISPSAFNQSQRRRKLSCWSQQRFRGSSRIDL